MSRQAMEIQQLPALKDIPSARFTQSPQDARCHPSSLAGVNKERPVRKLLVATDFSPASTQAVDLALSLARQYDANITLLHVIDISAQTVAGRFMPAAELMSCLWTTAFEKLGQLARDLSGQVKAQTAVEEGLPCEILVERSRDFDLLVIGQSPPKTPWKLFSHQTVRRVLQNAACPVIVASNQQATPLLVARSA